eukprot:12414526-Alexandrium_andersonii.AAC.1
MPEPKLGLSQSSKLSPALLVASTSHPPLLPHRNPTHFAPDPRPRPHLHANAALQPQGGTAELKAESRG